LLESDEVASISHKYRYKRGRKFEYRVMRYIEKEGIDGKKNVAVFRLAGSKPTDLIVISDGKAYLIECKTNLYLPPDDRKKLKELERITGSKVFVAMRKERSIIMKKLDDIV